ncbi:Peptidase-M14 domain-containing protein [Aphelenchoides besseyi]|nr:Peptidase-M14 domain-containing protein [Aphelenchoides besseyi]
MWNEKWTLWLIATICLTNFVSAARRAVAGEFNFERYQDWNEYESYLRSAAKQFPKIAKLKTIGKSREGRPLIGLKIGSSVEDQNKPGVWIDGIMHSREWPSGQVAVYFIDLLLSGYGNNERITSYINKLNIYIFPVINPDGLVFSKTSPNDTVRQWRKNRAPVNCSGYTTYKRIDTCCEGVDLNRNFDVAFRQTNYPFNNPCSDEYQGPFPFSFNYSEPETIAIRDFFLSPEINGNVQAVISLHTHGQFFILPYNFARKTYPDDYQDLKNVALRAASAITDVYGENEYRVGTGVDLFGIPATGGMIDWIKLNTKTKYVYVIELPPELRTSFAFQMKPHWLLPTCKETSAGLEVIVRQVMNEFG